jgi:hypothetical protein
MIATAIERSEMVPPHNEDAECAFLCCLLLDNKAMESHRPDPETFYFRRNQILADAFCSLWDSDQRVFDAIILAHHLLRRGLLEEAGGAAYLGKVLETVAHAALVGYYSNIVNKTYQRREYLRTFEGLLGEGKRLDSDIEALIPHAAKKLQELSLGRGRNRLPDFGFIDSKEFAQRKYENLWIIDFFLKDKQPCLVAGPSKTLKTTFLIELAVSVVSGTPLLGKYHTAKQRVAFVSAESGEETLQETAVRVCKSKGIEFADLSNSLYWAFKPPQINEPDHIASLKEFIEKNQITVLVIDPAYLSMGIGDDAKNQFVVGAVLQNLSTLQAETGCTPILCCHTNKNILSGAELELSHIAYAGFGQWARQWILLNRREDYDRNQPGSHKLFVSFGGSAGHAGSLALDVEEGDIQSGRKWECSLQSTEEASAAIEASGFEAKAKRDREKQQVASEERRGKILSAMRRFPDGETESEIRLATGVSGTQFKPVWLDLIAEQTIGPCGNIKKTNGKEYQAFKIIN